MNTPTLSVITPALNSEEFIEDAILSVSRQQDVAVEHIVIDGASTDSTMAIVKRHGEVKWISECDGPSDAINKGFLSATGDLVGWLNADDYYLPGGLDAMARAAQAHPEADVIYGDCVFVTAREKSFAPKLSTPSIVPYSCILAAISHPQPRSFAAAYRLGITAGLRLPGVHGLRIFRPAGARRIQLLLRAALHSRLPLARQQHQPQTTASAGRGTPVGAAQIRRQRSLLVDPCWLANLHRVKRLLRKLSAEIWCASFASARCWAATPAG